MSCLGLEENVEGDPCKFLLTSQTSSASVDSYVLHSSHPGVREVWTLQISQILDSQRNFLNGERARDPEDEGSSCVPGVPVFMVPASPSEYQRNHVEGGSGPRPPSTAASAGGGGGLGVPAGAGGGIPQGGAVPSGSQGGARRPSRIPQPSRLPQPLRHHGGADPEGPAKTSGMKPSVNPTFFSFYCEKLRCD